MEDYKGGVHKLDEVLNEVVGKIPNFKEKVEMFKLWPVFSGAQLSAVTKLKGYNDNTLFVYTSSSSAKSLLLLRKKEIIKKYNEHFENLNIKDLKILRYDNY